MSLVCFVFDSCNISCEDSRLVLESVFFVFPLSECLNFYLPLAAQMSLHVFGMLTGRHNDKVISVDGARAVSLSLVEDAWQCLCWAAACRIHISPSQLLDTPCQAIPTHSDFFRLILLWQLNICGWLCWCVKKSSVRVHGHHD